MDLEGARTIELADAGSHFYRSDFQVHSPRDTQWEGARPKLKDRDAWADTFVKAARAKGLNAVAIADHHDFAYIPYVRKAAENEKDENGERIPKSNRLVVFPALELTLSVPCQAVLILDADFPDSRLDDVLKALHVDPIDVALDSYPQTSELPDSSDINDLHEKLDKNDWLRGRYIILPNVTPSGHKTLLRQSFQTKYRDMVSVGGYLDCPVDRLKEKKHEGDQRKLEGKDPNWGSKRLALFQTSDARRTDFSTLGQNASWVKWATPTAEALRQACLAQDSRISQSEPSLPPVWISRVVVSQSKFMGRVDVAINPQYSALIGGRGTGKSTILDYIRWALCDQPAEVDAEDEVADPRVRQRRLIEATLKPLDSHVEVHCVINGIVHVVRRYAATGSVHLKVAEGEFDEVREAAVRSLIPIQAYSQKQLSSVAIRVDELLRFVTSPIKRRLEEIDRNQQEVAGRLRENYGTLQRFRDLTVEIERSKLRVRSLAEQAQSLRDGITGISDDDRGILDSKNAHDGVRSAHASWQQQVQVVGDRLAEASRLAEATAAAIARPPEVPDSLSAEVDAYITSTVAMLKDIASRGKAAASELTDKTADAGDIGIISAGLTNKLTEFSTNYDAVKERSSAHEAKLKELARLEVEQQQASELAQTQATQLDALGSPTERHAALRAELVSARRGKTEALQAQCETLSEVSDGIIRAVLSVRHGFESARLKFKALIAGSNVRSSRVESLFDALVRESSPSGTWELVLEELETLMLLEGDVDITSERTPVLSRLGLPPGDQKKIASRLTPDGWLDLSLVEISDYPEFEFRAKDDEYIPFDSASAGQQASALLVTMLSQGGTPLIIDQPEDDLDSESIREVVSRIWSSKSGRQIIFSSHNANLVVNGDADLVLVCAYLKSGDHSAGQIEHQGAIDVPKVREAITSVMEGGEKAFRLRKEKYGF